MKLALAVLALAAALAWRVKETLLIGKEMPAQSSHACQVVDHDGFAVEDLVLYKPGVLIGGAGGVIASVHKPPGEQRLGHLVAVDGRAGGDALPAVSQMRMTNLPRDFRFLPHGLFYSNRTQRLYAVNHAGVASTGSRVEVFAISEGADGLPTAEWLMAVGAGHLFGNCVLNSVVEGRGDDIYVTQWQNAPVPAGGADNARTLFEKLGRAFDMAVILTAFAGNTGVHHCTFDPDSRQTTRCRAVSWGFVHANGIAVDAARTKLFVNDVLPRKIYAFRIEQDGDLTPLPEETLSVAHPVDNIRIDDATGEMHQGTIPLPFQTLDHHAPVAGTHTVATQSKRGGAYDTLRDVMFHDGSQLPQISTCMPLQRGSDEGKRWSVCGSPRDPGILVCDAQYR